MQIENSPYNLYHLGRVVSFFLLNVSLIGQLIEHIGKLERDFGDFDVDHVFTEHLIFQPSLVEPQALLVVVHELPQRRVLQGHI